MYVQDVNLSAPLDCLYEGNLLVPKHPLSIVLTERAYMMNIGSLDKTVWSVMFASNYQSNNHVNQF